MVTAIRVNPYQAILEKFESLYQLRDYQIENNQKVREALRSCNNVFLQQPTGTGKSVQIVDITIRCIARDGRVLIVAPNDDLIANLERYFTKLGVMYGVIQASRQTNWKARVIIASAPTLHKRLGDFERYGFNPTIVLHDECKHGLAATFNKIITHFKELNVKQIGLDATPCRLDGKGFDDLFDVLITSHPVSWFIQNGHLAPFRVLTLPSLAYTPQFKKRGGEYDLAEQSKIFGEKTVVGDMASHWEKHTPGESTIIFASTIDHSQMIVEEYNDRFRSVYGRDIAVHLDAKLKTNKKLYKRYIDDFRSGKILVCSTVKLFDEGVDFPNVSCIQYATLTASLARQSQRDGRGLRYAPGKVTTFMDHVGAFKDHGLPDRNVRWSLKGVEDLKKYEFLCINCEALLHHDYRELRRALEPNNTFLCPECDCINILPKKQKRDGDSERIGYEKDTKSELVQISCNSTQFRINGFVSDRRRKNENELKNGIAVKSSGQSDEDYIVQNKRFGVVIKTVKLFGVIYTDWVYLCDLLHYSRSYALKFFKVYQVFQIENITEKHFREKCGQVDQWITDIMWDVYQNK